jgi:hypothetical protein
MIFSASVSVAAWSVHSRPFGQSFSQFSWKLWDSNQKTGFLLNSFNPYVISCSAKTAVQKASLNHKYLRISVTINIRWHQMLRRFRYPIIVFLQDYYNKLIQQQEVWTHQTSVFSCKIFRLMKPSSSIWLFTCTCLHLLLFLYLSVFTDGVTIFLVVCIAVKYKYMFTFNVKY